MSIAFVFVLQRGKWNHLNRKTEVIPMRMIRYGRIIYKVNEQERYEIRYEMVQFSFVYMPDTIVYEWDY